MIFIDTSIWIEFFRGNSKIEVRINELMDTNRALLSIPVYFEILNGARKNDIEKLTRVFSALPKFYPDQNVWHLIEKWIPIAKGKGENFSIPDYLIAAIASHHKHKLWSLDSDFRRMERLGFIVCE